MIGNGRSPGVDTVHPVFHNRGVAGLGGTSQSPQPHLKDGSVYRQNVPTVMDSNPRCLQLPVALTPTLLVVPRENCKTKELGDDMTHSARVATKSVSGPTP